MRIHHVAIKARDVERVAAFYRDVVGLAEKTRHLDPQGALRSIWLESGSAILMIERAGTPSPETAVDFFADPAGLHLLAFQMNASERKATRERLERAGVKIVNESRFTLYALDPEGNRIGLSSYPDTDPEG